MTIVDPTPPAEAGIRHIACCFDFISPYAYLAFELLPQALEGVSYSVSYKPVLFAAMLKHYGQLGPAEIAPKRDWTYRQAFWLAHSRDVPMQMPASHPFNPLRLLRLALACSPENDAGSPNRYVCETIFRHVWHGGAEAADARRFDVLLRQLAPRRDIQDPAVKAQLKTNTENAIAAGVFGVPAFVVDDKVFWGIDSLPMLRDYLLAGSWFAGGGWDGVKKVLPGVRRHQRGRDLE